MAIYQFGNYDVYYMTYGEVGNPCICFINGLSMRTAHWMPIIENLCGSGFRVLVFDMLGQGASDKPVLDCDFDDNAIMLAGILDDLEIDQAYVSGISYGGVVALKFAVMYPEKIKGLIPISCFSEIDGQLFCHSLNLHKALSQVGFEYYTDYLLPLNFTSQYLEDHSNVLDFARRVAVAGMEVYGIQNIMEKLADLPNYTPELVDIKCPTMIMNGENDWLTPRHLHEIMRDKIENSQLVLVPRVAHAMTIEIPDLCSQIIADFIESVETGEWVGDQSVWIANEELGAHPVKIPCVGNHLRMIPIEQSLAAYEESKQKNAESTPGVRKAVTKMAIAEPEYPNESKVPLNLAALKIKAATEKRDAKAKEKEKEKETAKTAKTTKTTKTAKTTKTTKKTKK